MPRISVIIPTNRIGGLDLTFEMLEAQTFRDFELVISDHLYPWRSEIVAEKLQKYSFPCRHVRPFSDPFPEQAYQRCANTALINADSEIVLFTCDYAYLPPGTLARHFAFHRETGRSRALIGTMQLSVTPHMHHQFPIKRYGAGTVEEQRKIWGSAVAREKAAKTWYQNYVDDLSSGLVQGFMWSTFEEPWRNEILLSLPIIHREPKSLFQGGPTDPIACNLKNDSFPLAKIVAINGFDEDFDQGHTYQDTEIATRLARIGVEFHLDPKNTVTITDMHHHVTIRKISRPEIANQMLFERKHHNGSPYLYANPGMDIKKMRREMHR